MKPSHKSLLSNLARWLVAGILLLWLLKSGKLASLRDLEKLFSSPWLFVMACVCVAINYIFNFFRWNFLLKAAEIYIPFSQVLRLSMIGQFFSIFMPGSVGGDLIKALYIVREYPKQKTDVVASILLDRVLGFLTLMSFASFFFVLSFYGSEMPASLKSFGSLLALGTIALLLMVLLPGRAVKILSYFKVKNVFYERVVRMLRAFGRHPIIILQGLALSFASQGASIFGMYCIGKAVYGALPWGEMGSLRFISATAVGTTASALPLSPMGLGVGQIAFAKVFKLLGAPAEAYGIVIISAVQIISFVINLSGALWFLKSKKEIQQAMN